MWDEDVARKGVEEFEEELEVLLADSSSEQKSAIKRLVVLMRAKVGVCGWKRLCRSLVAVALRED